MTQPQRAPAQRPSSRGELGHVPALDGVRGLAIFAVLAFHLNGQVQYRFHNRPATDALARIILSLSNHGWVGVDLFFVLSGFLITGILIAQRDSPSYYRVFYVRRALRIFPLYFGFLALCVLVLPALTRPTSPGYASAVQHQLYLWTYTSNLASALGRISFGPFAHFWSLAVEEHFYLLWPFVVRAVSPQRLGWICAGCLLLAFLFRFLALFAHSPNVAHLLMPGRLDEFGLGGLCAFALRRATTARQRAAVAVGLMVACAALALVGFALSACGGAKAAAASFALHYTTCAAGAACLIWLAVTNQGGAFVQRLLTSAPLRTLGKYSYGLYVVHVPLLPVLFVVQARLLRIVHASPSSDWSVIATFDLFAGVCVFAAAAASYHWFERRFLSLKRGFGYAPRASTGTELG